MDLFSASLTEFGEHLGPQAQEVFVLYLRRGPEALFNSYETVSQINTLDDSLLVKKFRFGMLDSYLAC